MKKFHEYSDTSLIMEGNKTYVYKVAEDNMTNKAEIVIGIRDLDLLK